eukprot:11364959-Heterocapsa_arctica.AAC.1
MGYVIRYPSLREVHERSRAITVCEMAAQLRGSSEAGTTRRSNSTNVSYSRGSEISRQICS